MTNQKRKFGFLKLKILKLRFLTLKPFSPPVIAFKGDITKNQPTRLKARLIKAKHAPVARIAIEPAAIPTTHAANTPNAIANKGFEVRYRRERPVA